jgi:hypothetical protein
MRMAGHVVHMGRKKKKDIHGIPIGKPEERMPLERFRYR